MNFESTAISYVRPLLGNDEFAGFTNGTLFINASEATARQAFHVLSREAGLGKLQITKIYGNDEGGEYAIDFTA
jgi:hypothetical protein